MALEKIYDYFFIVIILPFDRVELKSLIIFPKGPIYVSNVKLSMKLSVKKVSRPFDVRPTTVQVFVAPRCNSTRPFLLVVERLHKTARIHCFLWLPRVLLVALHQAPATRHQILRHVVLCETIYFELYRVCIGHWDLRWFLFWFNCSFRFVEHEGLWS